MKSSKRFSMIVGVVILVATAGRGLSADGKAPGRAMKNRPAVAFQAEPGKVRITVGGAP